MQAPTDIDFTVFSKDIKELERAIAAFKAAQAQNGGVALHFEVLIRRVNHIAELYS